MKWLILVFKYWLFADARPAPYGASGASSVPAPAAAFPAPLAGPVGRRIHSSSAPAEGALLRGPDPTRPAAGKRQRPSETARRLPAAAGERSLRPGSGTTPTAAAGPRKHRARPAAAAADPAANGSSQKATVATCNNDFAARPTADPLRAPYPIGGF